jgi:RHS repeat-associated protein
LRDSLGSVRQLADASGNIVQSYTYAPFGELLAAQGTRSSALQYTGEQNDLDTGLIYLRARWYDPATGRFTTRDPFPGFAVLPQTLHPYVYVNNNPVNLTDPSGEIADIFWDLAIFGVDLLLFFFDSINPTLDECTREQLLSLDRIALGLDLAAIAVPFIPGGSGLAGRLAGRGILILAQGGARASVRAIRVSVQAGVQAGVHASAMTKGGGKGSRGVVGGGSSGSSGGQRLTAKEAAKMAEELGYTERIPPQKAPINSHGQPFFRNPKTGWKISPDVDAHRGGVWKLFDRKWARQGTYNADLTIRLGD